MTFSLNLNTSNFKSLLLVSALCLWVQPALSQQADTEATANESSQQTEADESLDEIVVTGQRSADRAQSQAYQALEEQDLGKISYSSLGEALSSLTGVRNVSLGPAVGRPMIHGLKGVRVKSMVDRTSTMDASLLHDDHPVTVDPFSANLVEVIKGPSALAYGSEAIGGLINVETGRIPANLPDKPWSGRLEVTGSDNASRKSASGRLDWGAEDFAFHADFLIRDSGDYDIPGCLHSSYLEELEEEHEDEHEEGHDEDHEEEHEDEHEEVCGTVPNSYVNLGHGSIGGSYIMDNGYVGVAYTSNTLDMGVPLPHAHGEEEHHDDEEEHHEDEEDHHEDEEDHHDEHGEELAFITLDQERIDFDMHLHDLSDRVSALTLRTGISQYVHEEAEIDANEADATFINDSFDARLGLELVGNLNSQFGIHLTGRDYEVLNELEPTLPVSSTRLGVDWLMERPFGGSILEFGTRLEGKRVDSDDFGERTFSNYAFSVGIASGPDAPWHLSAIANVLSRSPAIEELAARGPHLGTDSVQEGNPDLASEVLHGVTFSANRSMGNFDTNLTAYHRSFRDFIYLEDSGEMEHGFPLYTYLQTDASFTGLDVEFTYTKELQERGELDFSYKVDTLGLSTRATGVDTLPNMPANRTVTGVEWRIKNFLMALDYTHSASVTKVAKLELPTDSWTDLSTYLEYRFQNFEEAKVSVYLKGKNLTDQEQRDHVSVVKDRVPMPGRMLEVGFRIASS